MPRHSPYRIVLADHEREVLEHVARSYTLPYWQVTRAQMVLMAAEGMRNDQIAAQLRCGRDVVSQWRKRFFEQRWEGELLHPGDYIVCCDEKPSIQASSAFHERLCIK